jgi:starch synthase
MPSRFEPCGLGQMIAMRYGALPVASRTGGLEDTVFEGAGPRANGFLASPGDAGDLSQALDRALAEFGRPAWRPRVLTAMEGDYSWGRSVGRYLELYGPAGAQK